MKFVVTRASEWGNEKPCAEAVAETYIKTDVRTTDDPAKIKLYKGETDWWYNKGTNHRIEKRIINDDLYNEGPIMWTDCIVRDIGEDIGYVIEVNNLEDLLRFQEKYGNLVISRTWDHGNKMPKIEIYDGFRE